MVGVVKLGGALKGDGLKTWAYSLYTQHTYAAVLLPTKYACAVVRSMLY